MERVLIPDWLLNRHFIWLKKGAFSWLRIPIVQALAG